MLPVSNITKRLWQGGFAMAVLIVTLMIGNAFVARERAVTRTGMGHDFLAFYTGGVFVATGRANDLYDIPKIREFQRTIVASESLDIGDHFGPFWNPPFFAWVFVPLADLSYQTAWNVWLVVNLTCAAGAIAMLCRAVGGSRRQWGLVALLTCVSLPFVQALGHGQNSCLSLLLVTGTIMLWRSNRAIAAGACAGLLFYKPQLGAIIAAVLILDLGWRALAGVAMTGVVLLATTSLTLPGALSQWFAKLPGNIRFMQIENPYLWERHVTLKAFWRLLLQGYATGDATLRTQLLTLGSIGIVGIALIVAALRVRKQIAQRDWLIASTVLVMPLLMPFYFDYDLLLMAVPATLLAAKWDARRDRPLLWAWVALFAWLFVNSSVAGKTHVNVTVILLTTVAGMALKRLWKSEASAKEIDACVVREFAAAA